MREKGFPEAKWHMQSDVGSNGGMKFMKVLIVRVALNLRRIYIFNSLYALWDDFTQEKKTFFVFMRHHLLESCFQLVSQSEKKKKKHIWRVNSTLTP